MSIILLNPDESEKACREISNSLPEYFGIPEANERYAKGVRETVVFGFRENDVTIGMIAIEILFPNNANIYWMGVHEKHRGKGIGASLLKEAEHYCLSKGCTSMTVETLSPSENDINYLKTYAFYKGAGFLPLFELFTYGPEFKMVYMLKPL